VFFTRKLSSSILVCRLFRQTLYRTDRFGYMACGLHKMPLLTCCTLDMDCGAYCCSCYVTLLRIIAYTVRYVMKYITGYESKYYSLFIFSEMTATRYEHVTLLRDMTENVIQGEPLLPFVLSLLYAANFDRMKSNYDKSYLNRPAAVLLIAPVRKVYLP